MLTTHVSGCRWQWRGPHTANGEAGVEATTAEGRGAEARAEVRVEV